ncbi:MAG: hypothetical protein RMH75_00970 [Archaeoglobaceae archaeon]|nr:hypothetical protein [Archaeoglobaceae archaeon]MDW7989230.1 hypothetical protein [Archaeoglobaceae archaeon]
MMVSETIKLSVSLKNTRALVVFDKKAKSYKIVDCSKRSFCRIYLSKNCPPYCEIVVAVKDYALKRRTPKAEISEL